MWFDVAPIATSITGFDFDVMCVTATTIEKDEL